MTTDLDRAVRSSLGDIIATAPQPDDHPARLLAESGATSTRRPYLAVAASLIVLAGVGGVLLSQHRVRESSDRVVAPSTANSEASDGGGDSVPANSVTALESAQSSLVPPTTLSHDHDFERVDDTTLLDWIGRWTLDFQPAVVYLGSTGAVEYALDMTESSYCIRHDGGSGCAFTDDGSPLPDEPNGVELGASTTNLDGGGQRWTLDAIAPTGVELQFYTNGSPACQMHAFPMTDFGDAVFWACENTTAVPAATELAATRGGRTLIAPVDLLDSSSGPDPADVTGAVIGQPVPPGSPPDLNNPPFWVAVADSTGNVVGYALGSDIAGQPDPNVSSRPVVVYDNHVRPIGTLGPDGYVAKP